MVFEVVKHVLGDPGSAFAFSFRPMLINRLIDNELLYNSFQKVI